MAPMMYFRLKEGYILKADDTFNLHGHEMKINQLDSCFFIAPISGYALLEIYKFLGIVDERMKIAESCGNHSGSGSELSPEFSDPESLSKFLIKLYELSPYKVGDTVKIVPRTKSSSEYPYTFTDSMAEYAGEEYKITGIEVAVPWAADKEQDWNGDPHRYELGNGWFWHPSMFEPAKISSISGDHKWKKICEEFVPTQKVVDESVAALDSDIDKKHSSDNSEFDFHLPNKVKTTIIL